MKVYEVPASSLRASEWATTHILRPDKVLLGVSMVESGWLQPLVVRTADQKIIDGHQRWALAQDDHRFVKRYGDMIPVVYHDVDEIDAMVIHVRLNRARGFSHPLRLSRLVKKIIHSGKYGEDSLAHIFAMSSDEVDLLVTGGLLKKKNWEEHQYSRAWVPVEVPNGTESGVSFIERPPNEDR